MEDLEIEMNPVALTQSPSKAENFSILILFFVFVVVLKKNVM
jgi:hypothetical protein